MHVEDHPLEYGSFEGVIPQGEYGGGTVMLWDRGTWEAEGDPAKAYQQGKLVFRLAGERLKGRWALIRMGGKAGQNGKNWLLEKLEDDEARSVQDPDVLTNMKSVASGRTMDEIANGRKAHQTASRKRHRSSKPSTMKRPDRRIRRPVTAGSLDPSSLTGAKRSAMPAKVVVVRRVDPWQEVLRARKQRRLIRRRASVSHEMPCSDCRAVPGYDVGGRHVVKRCTIFVNSRNADLLT